MQKSLCCTCIISQCACFSSFSHACHVVHVELSRLLPCLVLLWQGPNITHVACAETHLVIGYIDGTACVFDLYSGSLQVGVGTLLYKQENQQLMLDVCNVWLIVCEFPAQLTLAVMLCSTAL